MRSHRRVLALLVAGVVLLTGCAVSTAGSPDPAGAQGAGAGQVTRTSDGGQVTASVTWAGLDAGATFDVKLDTHSVDLDALDLANATLRNDRGESMTARPWAAPKGGHHREGVLTFGGDSAAFLSGAKWIELVISGVGDLPERTLRWEVGP